MSDLNTLTRQQLMSQLLQIKRENLCLNTELLRYKIMCKCYEKLFNILQTKYNEIHLNIKSDGENDLLQQVNDLKRAKLCEIKLSPLKKDFVSDIVIERDLPDDSELIIASSNLDDSLHVNDMPNNEVTNARIVDDIKLNSGINDNIRSSNTIELKETNQVINKYNENELNINDTESCDDLNSLWSVNSGMVCDSDTNDEQSDDIITGNNDQNKSKKFVCDWIGCGKIYLSKSGLNKHKKIHTTIEKVKRKKFKCKVYGCNYASNEKKNLVSHLRVHRTEKEDKCEHCNASLCDRQSLQEHKLCKHPELFPEIDEIRCDFIGCDYATKSAKSITRHKTSHFSFKCEACFKKFSTTSELDKHITVHEKKQKFICDFPKCNKSFSLINRLSRHREMHNEKTFLCEWPDCNKKFKSPLILKAHIKKTHEKVWKPKGYLCDWENCGKKFNNITAYKTHRNAHTGEKPFKCDWPGCDERFAGSFYVFMHKQRHHSDTRKDYRCTWPECSYTTYNQNNLVKHIDVHTGNKKWACDWPECDYKAANKSNLNTHKKWHRRHK